MIDDENHPRMALAHQDLLKRLGTTLGVSGRPLTRGLLDQMYEIVKDHRAECRQEGLDFPALVALVVERPAIIEWVRADADLASIRVKIVNFVRFHPDVKKADVVTAFRVAYPWLKPDDVLEPGGKAEE